MADRTALLFLPESPFPVRGGGRMRGASIIEYLRRRYTLDLVLFRDPEGHAPAANLPSGLARDVLTIDLPRHPRGGPHFVWRNLRRLAQGRVPLIDRFGGFESVLRPWLAGKRYDVCLATHAWVCTYAPLLRRSCARLFLDLQNVESVLLERTAEEMRGLKRLSVRRFAANCLSHERRWLPEWDVLLVTSAEDARSTLERVPGAHAFVVPNTIPLRPQPEGASDGTLVFSGTMDYIPNRLAVAWWVDEVAPLLEAARPGLTLRLVGSGDQAIRPLVDGRAGIEVTGAVEDAFEWIARSSVFVTPLRSGSGTRLKILEAWAAGVPVVSTRLGAEGLPAADGENLLLADTAPDFAAAILRLLDDPALAARLVAGGRVTYEVNYTWESAFQAMAAAGL